MNYLKWKLHRESWQLWRSQMIDTELRWYDTGFVIRRTISGREYFIECPGGDHILGISKLKDAKEQAEQMLSGGEMTDDPQGS